MSLEEGLHSFVSSWWPEQGLLGAGACWGRARLGQCMAPQSQGLRGRVQTVPGGGTSRVLVRKGLSLKAQVSYWKACEGVRDEAF